MEEIHQQFPAAHIVLAGDFSQMSEADVVDYTGLTSIVYQPTRGTNILDRIFVSSPCYSSVRVVKAVVKSDHKATVAHQESVPCSAPKTKVRKSFRKRTPTQDALSLQDLVTMEADIWEPIINDCQSEFDQFYATAPGILNEYYPERTITITSRDPEYITPDIKAKLRRKNRLMRADRIEEAELAERIGTDITKHNSTRLRHIDPRTSARDMWAAVRQVTGKNHNDHATVDGITATSLNLHYAAISTDTDYKVPSPKQTSSIHPHIEYLSEWEVFRQLDTLLSTTTG